MHNKLIVKKKNVYGNEMIYPVCELAKKFCTLLNSKTFTNQNIKNLKDIGYVFELEIETI